MKKFRLIDEDVVQQVYRHLKSFDKFDNLSIKVEETEIAVIRYTVKIEDEFEISDRLPHRDGVLGITRAIELGIEYLSWQVKFFEDVDQLLGSELFVKSYKTCIADYALGETVLEGVKYEFSLSHDETPDFHIVLRFTKIENGLEFENQISTEKWLKFNELEQTFSKFKTILDQNKEN